MFVLAPFPEKTPLPPQAGLATLGTPRPSDHSGGAMVGTEVGGDTEFLQNHSQEALSDVFPNHLNISLLFVLLGF